MTPRFGAAAVKALCIAFVIPSLQLIAFGFSYHYAEVLGLPRPGYPTDLRPTVGILYEVVTMRLVPTLVETALTPVLAYLLFLAVGRTMASYRERASLPTMLSGLGVTFVAAGTLLVYGYLLTFAFAAFAGVECANSVRFATGHTETYCGSVQHPGPIYLILRDRVLRAVRYQRAFLDADRHGLLRRVGESDRELFLIAVPAVSFSETKRPRYTPLWRIAKSDIALVSEQLPVSTLVPHPRESPRR